MGNKGKGKRPVSDSPKWEGPLWFIEFPHENNPDKWYVFSIATDEKAHDRTKQGLEKNGFTNYRERVENDGRD